MRRYRKRYVLISSDPQKDPNQIAKSIFTSYRILFGIFGLASADLKIARSYPDMGMIILRCALEHVPRLLLAAAFVRRIDSNPVALRTITISGTMKKIREKMRDLQV
ncbi:MAG: Rpp14/Pop5 family protein [Nitrososphaeria archaeon]|nr:Rpp14/Pop5 family protein [Nitrososphaeria archaeon]MDW8021342.1 Rpp14/Pop5 family protein [Nitrososphaerota archaeon]